MNSDHLPDHWWEMLPAIPRDQNSHAYRRLRRSWFDHTWANHPFLSSHCENHLTATLFENFILFNPTDWVGRLLEAAAVPKIPDDILECNWGYEAQDRKTSKMADVAIHARTAAADWAILVEAKAKGGSLKKTDANPDSYLELGEFDERDAAKTRDLVVDDKSRSGVMT
jgi:hypothetical protein